MCLISKTNELTTSERPIECYKKFIFENGRIMTPIVLVDVSEKCLAGNEPFVADGELYVSDWGWDNNEFYFGKGLIHTYAASEIENLIGSFTYSEILCRCEIAPNTKYVYGHTYSGIPVYGSERIWIREIVIDGRKYKEIKNAPRWKEKIFHWKEKIRLSRYIRNH